MVESCVAVPRWRGELFVAPTQLRQPFVGAVAHDQAVEGELAQSGEVTRFVDADPAIGWYPEETARLVVRKRQLLALQDRDGDE